MPTLDPFFDLILHEAGRKQFLVGNQLRIQNAILKRREGAGRWHHGL
jgi:hypothetical protein